MNILVCFLTLLAVFRTVASIRCYVCNATDTSSPFQCGELFERYDTPDIEPQDCSDVHGAQYCVKHIGRFEVGTISCYQCSSAETMDCSDLMINQPDSPLQPMPCDSVHDAEFCVKSTALYGGIGAKRFCSSKDLGNYCNYVQNVGDRMEYRSCIFTCSTDGCNLSSTLRSSHVFIAISTVISLVLFLA
ncbi:U-scoloptoxin(05)-Sm1a isoform X1 [Lutzomyia longipalpis]|uniref:U-scoloptoxin(05)-Sm1a isoform X1 n=1 Tax=Lutzomyia longipalpis TaxID=7200 RepID=UPI002484692A|nr:U-scoloptoxin(05)-Sm1a isoform X1 [Lutzomyia longipalpis]